MLCELFFFMEFKIMLFTPAGVKWFRLLETFQRTEIRRNIKGN